MPSSPLGVYKPLLIHNVNLYRWMEPLFCAGFCRELEHDDLYAHPSEADSEELLKRFNR